MKILASHTLDIQNYSFFRFIIILLIIKYITKIITKIVEALQGQFPCSPKFTHMGLSENSVAVLLIIIPTKWLFHWGYTPFSDISTCSSWVSCQSGKKVRVVYSVCISAPLAYPTSYMS